nr:hypothetical protein [Tanacetum cinerariifolium]
MAVNVVGARKTVVDWRDDTNDEPDDHELEVHYLYMAQIQEVTNFGPIFDAEPLQKDDQDDNDDLAKERDLLASLIEKLKCEIDDNKNRNKILKSSNKNLFDKLTSQIEDFENTNKSLESLNTHFEEANNELSKTNQLMFKDVKIFQDELGKRHDVNYMSKVELDWAKAKTKLMSYKTESQKSINKYSYQINDLNQKISDMKKELVAHQETISIMSQQKEDQKKFYKTHEEKELEKVIALENKINVLDDIQSQELIKKDKAWKQQELNSFRELNVKYFEIQYLKAWLQDKGIAISELKKLIEKMKGKSVEIKFEKPSVIRQSNAFKSQRQSILGVIPTTIVSRPQLKSNQLGDIVLPNNNQGNKQEVEDHCAVKFENDQIALILGYGDLVQGNIGNGCD